MAISLPTEKEPFVMPFRVDVDWIQPILVYTRLRFRTRLPRPRAGLRRAAAFAVTPNSRSRTYLRNLLCRENSMPPTAII